MSYNRLFARSEGLRQNISRSSRALIEVTASWLIAFVFVAFGVANVAHGQNQKHETHANAVVEPNDNRQSGGQRSYNEFVLKLEARTGEWFPDGEKGPSLTVAAFAEVGKSLTTPGPMIRVPVGTAVRVDMRNTLDKPLVMFGLDTVRGAGGDSVSILPGQSHSFAFVARQVGTFYYAGKTTRTTIVARHLEDSQLHGAIVVDPVAPAKHAVNDQVFLISWWYKSDTLSPTGLERAAMAINGRSWPHTESLSVTQGDSLTWRWINLTLLNHPMHLHGFYYRVDGMGDGNKFAMYDRDARREVVTEMVAPGATMQMAWSPRRAGNWIFHCHMATHMSHHVSIGTVRGVPQHVHDHGEQAPGTINTNADLLKTRSTQDDPKVDLPAALSHEMAGLVLGIHVATKRATHADKHVRKSTTPRNGERALHLYVRSKPGVFGRNPGFMYSLHQASESDSSLYGKPGPTLVLQQNQPVAVTIVNQADAGAAVHWHGIELESFPDGVPGWSGNGKTMLPAIAPGDSLTVRLTPPRAGTFMYHSHFNEVEQIASGLHGAIVVLAPGEEYNPEIDRVLMFSDDGPTANFLAGPYPGARLNGAVSPTLEFRAGVKYRLRLINIRTDYIMNIRLSGGANRLRWRVIAKDGRELPQNQIVDGAAELKFAPGEIYDVEFVAGIAGDYVLEHRMAEVPPPLQGPRYLPVIVR